MGIRASNIMYLYAGNYSQEMAIISGSQVVTYHGLSVQGGGLNAQENARMEKELYINYDHFNINCTSSQKTCYITDAFNFWRSGADSKLSFGNGAVLTMAASKNAILPTTKGYRALSCVESPEVWFMDFCKGKKKHWWKFWDDEYELQPDTLFMEVTEKPYIAMPTLVKGVVQIWGKRKGFPQRFEEKTEEQFKKNDDFWNTPNK
jgi:hypothetical protein